MAKKSDLQKVGFNQTASASSTGIAPLHGSHVADKGAVKKPFRFHPKILAGFFPVAFGVGDNGIYQFQNILFAAQIGEGIVPHGFLEIDGV